MNLHAIVAPLVWAINPNVLVTVQVSLGTNWGNDGTAVPTYAPPVQVLAQVQSLTFGDIQQIDGLNIQGVRRAIYLNGEIDGLIRAKDKGGDLVQLPDGTVWLVAHVLEYWPDWTKAVITLQDDAVLPSAQSIRVTWVTTGATQQSPYQALASDVSIFVNVPAPAFITLPPSPMNGQYLIVKDASGNAANNNIIIHGGTYLIDGGSSYTMNINYESLALEFNGVTWSIF